MITQLKKILKYKNKIYQVVLILIGFTMFIAFIWFRFIRKRLPRDIPFPLSVLGFFILIDICIIYSYIVISLLRQGRPENPGVNELVKYIFMPLEELDHFIKNLKAINKPYKHSIIYIANKLKYYIIETDIFYYLFRILPRIILVTVLHIDVFWLHYISNFYNFILIGVFLFLARYIIYSFRYAKEHFIVQLQPFTWSISTAWVHGWVENLPPEDPDEEDFLPETMPLTLRQLIEFETLYIIENGKEQRYSVIPNEEYRKLYKIKNNILEEYEMTRKERLIYLEELDKKVANILNISVLIEYYDMANNSNDRIRKLKILIFTNYLMCWLYTLIISLHTLNILDIINLLENTYKYVSEPF